MSNAPAAPSAMTATEKVAAVVAAFVLGVLLAVPATRGAIIDSVTTTAQFAVDTTVNGARGLWLMIDHLFGSA